MCPLVLRFLFMRFKWNAAISCSFNTSNGVKQEGVLSPLLFNVYLDEFILLLNEQGVGCHMNGMFVGALMIINHKCLGSVIRELCETRDSCNTLFF